MSEDVWAQLRRHVGQRMRLYYLTRTYAAPDGVIYAVWGGPDRTASNAHATAHVVGRIQSLEPTHVIFQPDAHARPVAIHANSIVRVAHPLLIARS